MYESAVRFISIVALCLAIVSEGFAQGQLDLPGREVARRAFASVVMLVTDERGQEGAFGSGFVVAPGVVATNYHVIRDAEAVYGRVVGSRSVHRMGRILASDPKRDLALLFFPDLDSPVLPLAVNSVAAGDTIYVVGSPEGLEGTLSRGIVSSVRESEGLLQIDAAVSHGSSGGPVIDQAGAVVGVVVATAKSGQNLNFAIPASFLALIVQEARLTPRFYSPPAAGSVVTSKQRAFDRISQLYQAEDYDLAFEAAAAAASSWPDDPAVLYYAGACAYSADKSMAAVDYYRAVTRLEPAQGIVWGELARALRSVGLRTREQRWIEESAVAGREAIRLGGASSFALDAIAASFEEVGKVDEALSVMQRIAAATPSDPDRQRSLGHLYSKLGRWREAHAAYRRYLDLGGERTEYVLTNLAESAARNSASQEAVDAYLEALDLKQPFNPQATYSALWDLLIGERRVSLALDIARKELVRHPKIAVAGIWSLAYALREANDAQNAVEVLEILAVVVSKDADALLQISKAYSSLNRHEDALAMGRRVQRLAPSSYKALDKVGEELAFLRRDAEAIAAFEQADVLAKGLDEERIWRLEDLFHLYRGAKRFNDALSVAKRMERGRDDAWPGLVYLQVAFEDLGRPDEVIPYCEKRIAKDPTDDLPVSLLAATHEKAKRYGLAATVFKNFLRASSKPAATTMIALGRVMELDGKRTEASDLYRLALEQSLESTAPLVGLAAVHEEFGRLSEAEALYARACTIEPTNPDRVLDYGRFLVKVGRRDEAMTQYSKLQDLSVSNKAAKYQASKLFELLFP